MFLLSYIRVGNAANLFFAWSRDGDVRGDVHAVGAGLRKRWKGWGRGVEMGVEKGVVLQMREKKKRLVLVERG